MVKYFDVLDVDALTKRGYRSKHNIHIKPVLGTTKLTRLDVEVLDCFYANSGAADCTAAATSSSSTEPQRLTSATACSQQMSAGQLLVWICPLTPSG